MAGEKEAHWSLRSRMSLATEALFRAQASELGNEVQRLNAHISQLEASKERALKAMQHNAQFNREALDFTLKELETRERLLKACKEQISKIEAERDLFLREEERGLPEREKQQMAAAQCAQRIMEKDEEIERVVGELRQLLQARGELSAELNAACKRLGFAEDAEWRRLERILESLPQSVSSETRSWAVRFLGEAEGRGAYVVIAEQLTLPETLAHAGVYFCGETVYLSGIEAQEYLRADAPSIMTAEAFQAVKAEAAEKGVDPEIVLLIQKADREGARSVRVTAAG